MKIKTKKKFRLDELIEYKKNGTKRDMYEVFKCDDGLFEVRMSGSCLDYVRRNGFGHKNEIPNMPFHTLFTVEVEEELTEDTEIHGATLIYYNELSREVKRFRYADVTSPSLKHIIQTRPDTVALAVFKGKQLIWTKEHGIPGDGILEEDSE